MRANPGPGIGQGGRGIGESPAVRILLCVAALAVLAWLMLLPLAVLFTQAFANGTAAYIAAITDPDALAAIRLTLLVAAIVVPINTLLGLAAAWSITRFRFPGRAVLTALIALPFSVSPVVSGLVYVLLFGAQGWFGPMLSHAGIQIVFALPGIVLATIFVTLPFVAGQLIPVMDAQGIEEEEAALILGATGLQMFLRVSLPKIKWALLHGVLLCSARSMGEFGAVSVISGHIRGLTNTVPLHIEILYNEYDIAAAFAVATLLAAVGMLTIALRTLLEWRRDSAFRRGSLARLQVAGLEVA